MTTGSTSQQTADSRILVIITSGHSEDETFPATVCSRTNEIVIFVIRQGTPCADGGAKHL